MRKRVLISLALCCFCAAARAADQNYAARFKELKEQKAEGAEIDSLLDEWRTKQPNDLDAWITSANYYFNESVGTVISKKKAEKGDFKLTDKKTGKAAGSISFGPNVAETTRDARKLLTEATTKFPDRLDIWCGLAWMYQEGGDFDNEFATLQKMVPYAREHPANLRWLKGEKLSEPMEKFVPEKLHSYAMYYEKKENPEDDKRFLKIATYSAEQFPNHPFAFNDVALYYSIGGDNTKTREWLEKANQVDPKDALVIYNLGHISAKMGDKAAAKKWFETAIKLDPDSEDGQRAKDELKKLNKK